MRVLAALVLLSGLLTASAGAAQWHSNGDKTLSSTSANGIFLVLHHSGGISLTTCTTSSVAGTLNGPTSTRSAWLGAATLTPTFTGCTVVFGVNYTFVCSPAELAALTYSGGTTLATAGGGVTTALLTNIDCRISLGATTCSTLTGTLTARYTNPNPIVTGTGSLTLTSLAQSLVAQNIGAGCGVFPPGTATITTVGPGANATDLAYTLDGPNAPYIFRTP